MIRIVEEIENDKELKLKDDVNSSQLDNQINDYLGITLAGLNDNIYFTSIDTSDYPYITFEYYVNDKGEDIYLGSWDFNIDDLNNMSDNERINYLDNISAEVMASASNFIEDVED